VGEACFGAETSAVRVGASWWHPMSELRRGATANDFQDHFGESPRTDWLQ
jgi:hypothetical protein